MKALFSKKNRVKGILSCCENGKWSGSTRLKSTHRSAGERHTGLRLLIGVDHTQRLGQGSIRVGDDWVRVGIRGLHVRLDVL